MDRKYIDLHLVTDRYLRGALAESEEAEFEERLTWDQELMDELDLAERLREGLRASAAEGRFVAVAARGGVLAAVWSEPHYAAAASFVLAVTASWLLFTGPLRIDSIETPLFNASPVELVPLVSVRGPDVQAVRIPESSPTVLLIDAAGSYPAYRVAIRRADAGDQPIWTDDNMRPTYLEMLAIVLPPDFLQIGRYEVNVEGMLSNAAGDVIYEQLQQIPFNAVSED